MRNPFRAPTLDEIVSDLKMLENKLAEHVLNQGGKASELKAKIADLQVKVDAANVESIRAGRIAGRLSDLLA